MFPTINGYQITQHIGSGSYGSVYEAIRESDKQTVAIKTSYDYEMESTALMSINSDYVVDLLDEGSLNGDDWGYIVMPVLYPFKGKHLTDAMLIEFCVQLATVLKDLDYAGWVHGDLHGGNIMFDEYCNVKVVDFGLSCEGGYNEDLYLFGETIKCHSFYIEHSKFDWRYIVNQITDMEEVGDILEYFLTMRREHVHGDVSLMPIVDK